MTTSWPETTLGELAVKLQDGPFGSNLKSSHYVDHGVRVIRLQNIGSGRFDDSDRAYISEVHFAALRKHECLPGDVLIATLGDPILRACVQPPWLSRALNKADCLQLRCDRSLADPDYISWFLNSEEARHRAKAFAHGQTRLRLNLGQLRAMPIPLPPIEEQYRIATILDKAELLRAKRRTSLTVLHSLTQAMFVDLFGDPVTNPRGWRLGYIGDLLDSATYGTSRKAGPEGGLPVLRMGNVTVTGEIEIEDLKFVDLPPTDIDKHTVRRGDILFNRTNSADLVGKAAVYRFDDVMAYAGYLVRLRCSADTSPEYLGAFLNLPSTKRIFRAMCKSIIGMANINARELQGVPVPIPPSELQHTFETRISKVRSVAARLAVDRTDLDALFGSLRHRAFSGAL